MYNPLQARDPLGKWVKEHGGASIEDVVSKTSMVDLENMALDDRTPTAVLKIGHYRNEWSISIRTPTFDATEKSLTEPAGAKTTRTNGVTNAADTLCASATTTSVRRLLRACATGARDTRESR